MSKKKNKNIINPAEAIELFNGFGYKAMVFNHYQIRITPEETDRFFDWYHTTGSLVVNHDDTCSRVGGIMYKYLDAEEVVEAIRKNLDHDYAI